MMELRKFVNEFLRDGVALSHGGLSATVATGPTTAFPLGRTGATGRHLSWGTLIQHESFRMQGPPNIVCFFGAFQLL